MPAPPTRILVVEDEALIAREIAARLAGLGYDVASVVGSGEEALERLAEAAPDVALVDIRLAGDLDGIETARELRRRAGVLCVCLSAFTDESLLQEAAEAEFLGYLVKPFEERELHAAIQLALRRHRLEVSLQAAAEALETKVEARTTALEEADRALRRSEERYRSVFQESLDGLALADMATGTLLDCNPALCSMVGRRRDELIGQPQRVLHPPSTAHVGGVSVTFALHRTDSDREVLDAKLMTSDGDVRDVEIKSAIFELEGRRVMLGVFRDITERHRQELALRRALEERDLALREIHHRVKNNLQLVSSLLSLQFRDIDDVTIHDRVRECQLRVRAIALVHEKLYQSRSLVSVRLDEYIGALARALVRSLSADASIELRVVVEPVEAVVERALKLGLIVNELVSNALRHGFAPSNASGSIEVTLASDDDGLRLEVGNSGRPFPAADERQQNRDGFGLGLVRGLVAELGGTVSLHNQPGPRVEVRFPKVPGLGLPLA